jgi:V/A-type H+-transporting ATPase subunit D
VEEVRPTRSELLERKTQIKLAQQGMDLLKRKRDALLVEFMDTVSDTVELSEKLHDDAAEAQYALTVARAVDGLVAVHSAAMAGRGGVSVDVGGTKIMGVAVPVLSTTKSAIRGPLSRGYSVVGVSSRVDHTAERFEVMIDRMIDYAGKETRLRRVGEEIQKTSRRVNALEQVRLPGLTEQVAYIRQTLDERAREDLFRLKKVKKKIERKKRART